MMYDVSDRFARLNRYSDSTFGSINSYHLVFMDVDKEIKLLTQVFNDFAKQLIQTTEEVQRFNSYM